MAPFAIRVDNIGKQYRIGARKARALTMREAVAGVLATPLHNLRRLRSLGAMDGQDRDDAIWALRGVSFEVGQGEVLGIVGNNGAGKSTLLKVLSRITSPTTGRAWVHGRMGSLLEVGTGFHPELTGRDNIYLNGAILGMERSYIASRFDEIVAFAEVERFLDTPVKHYSSGMYLRLAFAVAAHLPAEILVIDEVLAVGDAGFQKKCLAKMGEVANEGRTILFVSHNLNAIQRMCPRSVLLQGGRLMADGSTSDVLRQYLAQAPESPGPRKWIDLSLAQRTGTQEVLFQAVQYSGDKEEMRYEAYPDGPLELKLALVSNSPRTLGSLGVSLHDQNGARLISADTKSLGLVTSLQPGRNVVCLRIESLHLSPGVYQVTVWASGREGRRVFDRVESAFALQLVDPHSPPPLGQTGSVTCRFQVLPID
jgi:ABC-type polysaccharide/polyol phosphate transport system ATPase subunit